MQHDAGAARGDPPQPFGREAIGLGQGPPVADPEDAQKVRDCFGRHRMAHPEKGRNSATGPGTPAGRGDDVRLRAVETWATHPRALPRWPSRGRLQQGLAPAPGPRARDGLAGRSGATSAAAEAQRGGSSGMTPPSAAAQGGGGRRRWRRRSATTTATEPPRAEVAAGGGGRRDAASCGPGVRRSGRGRPAAGRAGPRWRAGHQRDGGVSKWRGCPSISDCRASSTSSGGLGGRSATIASTSPKRSPRASAALSLCTAAEAVERAGPAADVVSRCGRRRCTPFPRAASRSAAT